MSSLFSGGERDRFRPQYGGVQWHKRLNNFLEEAGLEIQPVEYSEGDKPKMQITQENTMIFWNLIANELDCVAIMYDQDDGVGTWHFREDFKRHGLEIEHVAQRIGQWCLQTLTMYPMENVVDTYEARFKSQIPDYMKD